MCTKSSLLWSLTYQCLDSENFDIIINVRVGSKENERIFQIHRAILAKSSSHINKKMLAGGVYKKGDDLPIIREDVEASVLQHF